MFCLVAMYLTNSNQLYKSYLPSSCILNPSMHQRDPKNKAKIRTNPADLQYQHFANLYKSRGKRFPDIQNGRVIIPSPLCLWYVSINLNLVSCDLESKSTINAYPWSIREMALSIDILFMLSHSVIGEYSVFPIYSLISLKHSCVETFCRRSMFCWVIISLATRPNGHEKYTKKLKKITLRSIFSLSWINSLVVCKTPTTYVHFFSYTNSQN